MWKDTAKTLSQRGIEIYSYGIKPGVQQEQLESITFQPGNADLIEGYVLPKPIPTGVTGEMMNHFPKKKTFNHLKVSFILKRVPLHHYICRTRLSENLTSYFICPVVLDDEYSVKVLLLFLSLANHVLSIPLCFGFQKSTETTNLNSRFGNYCFLRLLKVCVARIPG